MLTCVAESYCRSSPSPWVLTDQHLLPLPVVEPGFTQPGVAATPVFRWERSVNGLPERVSPIPLFPCNHPWTRPGKRSRPEEPQLPMQPAPPFLPPSSEAPSPGLQEPS